MDIKESVRFAAARRGDSRYHGTPCRLGHAGERYVGNGFCCECQRAANQATKARLRDLLAAARENAGQEAA